MLHVKNYKNRPMFHGVIKKKWHIFIKTRYLHAQ